MRTTQERPEAVRRQARRATPLSGCRHGLCAVDGFRRRQVLDVDRGLREWYFDTFRMEAQFDLFQQ